MARISRYPIVRHVRSEASAHLLCYRHGRLVKSQRGGTAWFRTLDTGLAEVPLDDRELTLVLHGISADFQDVMVQGVVTWRVIDPELLASRVDFTVDAATGRWRREPLEQIGQRIVELAQQVTVEHLSVQPVQAILRSGTLLLRRKIGEGLAEDTGLAEAGIEIVAVRVSSVRPSTEVERALQTPEREVIQQQADEATFQRRALAVEKERAIAENELQNQIELARREESLILQHGENERQSATQEAEAQRIRAESVAVAGKIAAVAEAETVRLSADAEAARRRLMSDAEAEAVRAVESARNEAEAERMQLYETVPVSVMWALAGREIAGKLVSIDHVNITPDMITPLLGDLMGAATERLKG